MLLISWPSTAVSRKSPSEQRVRPGVADDVDQPVGELLGRAGLGHRRRERDHPADEDDRRPRDRRGRPARSVSTPSRTIAPAASSPATAGGTAPVASSDDHRRRARRARASRPARAARPAGARLGRVDDEHVGVVEVLVERAPGALQQQRVAGRERRLAGPSSSPLRCTARTTRSPLSVTMPGKTRLADRAPSAAGSRPRRRPSCAREQRAAVVVELVLVDQRARVVAEVARDRRAACAAAAAARRRARRSRSSRRRAARRRARTRSSRSCPTPGVVRGLGDDHVHGRPGEREQRAGVRGERERQQQLRRRAAAAGPPSRPTTGSSAATAPLTLISAVSSATSSIMRTISRVRLSPDARDQLLPGPRRHARSRRAPSLTTNSEAMKSTVGSPKPGERLIEVEHAGRPQRQRRRRSRRSRPAAGPRRRRRRPRASTRKVIVVSLTPVASRARRRVLGVDGRARAERDPDQVPGDEEQRPARPTG